MIVWIFTTTRSGSTYFTGEIWRRLGGKPKIMEYFNPDAVPRQTTLVAHRERPVRSYLDHLVSRESERGLLAVKMLAWQVEASCRYPDFVPQIEGRKIVVLRRRDVIRQGISLSIARSTKVWSSRVASRMPERGAPSHDFEAIREEVRVTERQNALLGRLLAVLRLEHPPVWYEDFVAAPDTESHRVLEYLGLERASGPLRSEAPFQRQSSDLNAEFLERFLVDERKRLCGDGTFRGPPLFPAAADPSSTSA